MSYAVQIGPTGFEEFASNGGYGDFADWVQTLDVDKYESLAQLCHYGLTTDLPALEKQLGAAIEDDAPKGDGVLDTAKQLLDIVTERDPDAAVATITNGVGEGGDDDEEPESKAFVAGNDVPEFAPPQPDAPALANALRHIFRQQHDAVMQAIDSVPDMKAWLEVSTKDAAADDAERERVAQHFADVSPVLDLSTWDIVVAKVAEPLLTQYAREAVRETIDALPAPRLDPDLFNVVDRNLPQAVQEASLKFAQSTNETTSMELTDALDELRGELQAGVELGDTRIEMRKRVQAIFDDLSDRRADLIAHTEASRARHDAQLTTVKESNVVSKKNWLSSSDACQKCLNLAAMGPIPLDANFTVTKYGPVKGPPLHVSCYCSQTFELKDLSEDVPDAVAE